MFIVLLHDHDLSGSLNPEFSNSHELEVYGPFDTDDEAADFIDEHEEYRWLCQVHEVTPPSDYARED